MKNMKTLALLPMLAVTVCAQAQQRKVTPTGQDYTINNITPASGDNVTYQWFRDGAAIANATGASYTVPANLAKMENGLSVANTAGARFQRAAYGIDCPGGMSMSNEIIVYFCELMVNGVCWARANSNETGRISANPWEWGFLYQWNRPTVGYSNDPSVPISNWNTTPDYAATWTNGIPCPDGWRLPTRVDLQNLSATSQPQEGIWFEGGVRGIPAGTNGRLYGYNTAYCTMSNMNGCVFLPAAGHRISTSGNMYGRNTGGYYWSSMQSNVSLGFVLFSVTANSSLSESSKAYGFSIRCVQDVVQ